MFNIKEEEERFYFTNSTPTKNFLNVVFELHDVNVKDMLTAQDCNNVFKYNEYKVSVSHSPYLIRR